MGMNLPILTFIISVLTVCAFGLYFREYIQRKRNQNQSQRINQETKQQSIQLLNAARQAETQVLAESDYVTKKIISEFEYKLQNIIAQSEKSITISQDQLINFMKNLQSRSAQFEEASNAAAKERINQLFERLETRLADFLVQTEQKTTTSIELELKATRQLIDTYKSRQLKLIDDNIIAMMEQTLNIVLAKKLSLKDQLDLVYEALEKAKIEKFVV